VIVGRRFIAGLRKPNKNTCDESRRDDRKVNEAPISIVLAGLLLTISLATGDEETVSELPFKKGSCHEFAGICECWVARRLRPPGAEGTRSLYL
jgi:hypothetical protein